MKRLKASLARFLLGPEFELRVTDIINSDFIIVSYIVRGNTRNRAVFKKVE